ncbi:isoprenyl transferase [bacterium]|nr:isoprenyl transferase [bacterium]
MSTPNNPLTFTGFDSTFFTGFLRSKGLILGKTQHPELAENGPLPGHIAIIMDGNGRWAKKRGLPRVAGHRKGVETVRKVVEACSELGVSVLTLYTFSTENWNRPKEEVSALMKLLLRTLENEIDELHRNNVRLMTIGELDRLQAGAAEGLRAGVARTAANTGLILNLALSYGSREEIVHAVRSIAREVQQGRIDPEAIDSALISDSLYTAGLPDPDLLIRTSGELRLSNFLLWQLAYTELFTTDVYWPDFQKKHLYKAISSYQKRERRFGMVSEQLR